MTDLHAERAYEVVVLPMKQQVLPTVEMLRAMLAEEVVGASCVMGLQSVPVLEQLRPTTNMHCELTKAWK